MRVYRNKLPFRGRPDRSVAPERQLRISMGSVYNFVSLLFCLISMTGSACSTRYLAIPEKCEKKF